MGDATGKIETSHAVLPQRVKRRRRMEPATTVATTTTTTTAGAQKAVTPPSLMTQPHLDVIKALLQDVRDTSEKLTRQFEYLDHTADVQLHAWGGTLRQAFEQVAACMFNYMTPLEGIEAELRKYIGGCEDDVGLECFCGDGSVVRVVKIEDAKDMDSLMFQWLDELLFGFSTEYFVPVRIRVVAFDTKTFTLTAVLVGGVFDAKRDVCGTEIKAITYSAMQILDVCDEKERGLGDSKGVNGGQDGRRTTPLDRADVYVIVDI